VADQQFPLVRDADPIALLAAPPVRGTTLQRYFPRDVDSDLDKALTRPRKVLVVHQTFSGARRAVYEALLRNLPTLPLLTDSNADEDWDAAPENAVLWLDLTDRGRRWANVEQVVASISRWSKSGRYVVILAKADNHQVVDMVTELTNTVVRIDSELTERERATAREWFDTDVRSIQELASLTEPVLAPSGRHVAGYHADTDTGEDQLGITTDVNMLADVVVSRFVKPPLSIGLFGNWGTGKSFFMRQMRARVDELADAAAKEKARPGLSAPSYCSTVRQITFNAWHYVEANLWASLATHIFDDLATEGSDKTLRARADKLAAMRRTEQSLLTKLSAVRLERRLVAAQQKPLDLTVDDFAWVAKEMGVPAATTADVRRFATELHGLGVETRRFWTLLRHNRFAWITIGIGVALAGALAVLARTPVWPALAGFASLVVAAAPALKRVREAAARIQRATKASDQRIARLDEEEQRLEREIAELATGHDATAFAKSRHASEDYRQHLGIVSLLRRDLETFAAILDDEGDHGLERIVLYIDDLDRCPPEVVIKVLEAVHLLVALPVFVVVVAVDPRWLHQAIRHHYAAMLPDPVNYLEKIFQIPFRLSTMDEGGFGNLVQALAGKARAEPEDDHAATQDAAELSQNARLDAPSPPPPPAPAPPLELRPRQLDISPDELRFLTTLASLVPTPRAAKRLLNLYRLVRARLSDSELDQFVRSGEFQAVLALLATSGNPEAAPVDLPAAAYERWLPLVRRFSFGHKGTAPGDVDGGRSGGDE
jgi:hypothetical protein